MFRMAERVEKLFKNKSTEPSKFPAGYQTRIPNINSYNMSYIKHIEAIYFLSGAKNSLLSVAAVT
jgi:hypothetical protein